MLSARSMMILIFTALCVIILWFAWWRVPFALVAKKKLDGARDSADVEDAYRKSIAQAIGAGALILGLYFTMQQYFLATQAQHIDQYQKGFEALKGTDVGVHVGAIYGLEIMANAVPEWRQSTLMGLSAAAVIFSRDPENRKEPKGLYAYRIRPDAEAALLVISRAPNENGSRYPLALGFFPGVSLHQPRLNGANLEAADLSGADLYKAQLFNANLYAVKLSGANLSGADLSQARLVNARLCEGINFAVPHLQTGSEVPTQLTAAKFYSADMRNVWLIGARLDGAILWDANLESAQLQGSLLYKATFQKANLNSARFDYSDARNADFGPHVQAPNSVDPVPSVSAKGAIFDYANLNNAKFASADLTKANFRGANLKDADFTGANTEGVNFETAYLCRTKLPNGVRSDHCNTEWTVPAPPPKLNCPD